MTRVVHAGHVAAGSVGDRVWFYRHMLPAAAAGHDWAAVTMRGYEPSDVLKGWLGSRRETSVGGKPVMPDFDDYDVVVVSPSADLAWKRWVQRLRQSGTVVLADTDDYYQAILDLRPDARQMVNRWYELLREVDGVICATTFTESKHKDHNQRTYVCRTGLDTDTYALPRGERDHVVIGFAGNPVEHAHTAPRWAPAIINVMDRHPTTRFRSVGLPLADWLRPRFGDRCDHVGVVGLNAYPAELNEMDIILSPSAEGDLFRGKSDLRWLQASALGIPTVADTRTYSDVRHRETGMTATASATAERCLEELVTDPELRCELGQRARAYVREHRDVKVAVREWESVFDAVAPATAEA